MRACVGACVCVCTICVMMRSTQCLPVRGYLHSSTIFRAPVCMGREGRERGGKEGYREGRDGEGKNGDEEKEREREERGRSILF